MGAANVATTTRLVAETLGAVVIVDLSLAKVRKSYMRVSRVDKSEKTLASARWRLSWE
jgi:hypothetical protein